MTISWQSIVNSSNVARAGSDEEGDLYVEFSNGAQYQYPGAAATHLAPLVAAQSPGGYVHRWLKGLPQEKIA
jgi:hypothetical protein